MGDVLSDLAVQADALEAERYGAGPPTPPPRRDHEPRSDLVAELVELVRSVVDPHG